MANGKSIDAVAQTTKQGWVFLFDRTNGQPLFPMEERKVPPSTVPGEVTSPTQPVPLLRRPIHRRRLAKILLPSEPRRRTRRRLSSFVPSLAGHNSFPAWWANQPSSFPASVAARSGVDRPSIPIPASFISMPIKLLSQPRWSKTISRPALGYRRIAASARSVTVWTVPAPRRPILRWWMCTAGIRRRKLPASSSRAAEECPRSLTFRGRNWMPCSSISGRERTL